MNKKFNQVSYKKADICVLCFSADNKNYGANFVCYAMEKVIEKIGYKVNILNFYKKDEKFKDSALYDFRKKFINLTPPVRYFFQFYLLNFFYKIFIVGSDQVFNTLNTKPYETRYFLDFVKKNRGKIAFSASFGMEQFVGDKKLIKTAKKLLSKFDFISVREKSAYDVLNKTFCSNFGCKLTLDPVLMLECSDYSEVIQTYDIVPSYKYIAYYILSVEYGLKTNETSSLLCQVKNKFKIPLINILYDAKKNQYTAGQWLNYIKNAEFIITDSFHGVCFSIIYKKKFVFLNRIGITRVKNLLNILGIDNVCYNNSDDIIIKDIDYTSVYKKLEVLKEYSYEYLKNSIDKIIKSKLC